MIKNLENLVKVKTYADSIGVSTTWVYKLAEKKEIEIVKIDGVSFVKIK